MVNLDGSQGEGGGQSLRSAIVWSLVTGTPFRMENIRAKRKDPGLKAQHVHVLKSLLPLGPVAFTGAQVGSTVVTFAPAPLRGADYRVDVGTAGSIPLLLQTLLPAVLLAEGPSRVVLEGGTDVAWSPPIDYVRNVVLGVASRHARRLSLEVVRRGFYPKGGGRVVLEAEAGAKAPPYYALDRGPLEQIRIQSVASRDLATRKVAERQAAAAEERLRSFGVRLDIRAEPVESRCTGSVITCTAEFAGGARLGGDALGGAGRSAERVGREAGERLSREIQDGAVVDAHAADQLIVWLGISGGALRTSEISGHVDASIWIARSFVGDAFEVEGKVIRCSRPWVPGTMG